MRRPPKWMLVGSATLLAAIVAAAVVLYLRGGARLARPWSVDPAALDIPTDATSVERGRHLAHAVALCTACHGDDLGGGVIAEDPVFGTIVASNLTRGRGGRGSVYGDADYVRAVRHGVNVEGRGMLIMHSDGYQLLDREDLAAVVAYVKSVPPADNELPESRVGAVGRIMLALGLLDAGAMPLIPAEVIDHEAPLPEAPESGASADYGRYLVSIAMCSMCHGPTMKGGPPIEPNAPPGPDITGYGMAGGWTRAQFIETIRTGTTPYARVLDPAFMPWEVYGRMTDDELTAIYLYLGSLGG